MQPYPEAARPLPRALPRMPSAPAPRDDSDAGFVQLLDAYRRSGGIARQEEVAAALGRTAGGAAALPGWIRRAEVLHFSWNGAVWLPVFQFVRPRMALHPGLRRVLAQLEGVLDEWDLALWFARPNPWLGGALPADAFAKQAVQVEQAARADRFAFRG